MDPILSELLKLGYIAVSGGGDSVLTDRAAADPKDRIAMYERSPDTLRGQRGGVAVMAQGTPTLRGIQGIQRG